MSHITTYNKRQSYETRVFSISCQAANPPLSIGPLDSSSTNQISAVASKPHGGVMTQKRRIIRQVVAAGALSVVFVICGPALASDQNGSFTEEFHQVYPLSAQGRIQVDNLNGPVHITAWDRDEVKVDAVKSAWKKERLDGVKIEIQAEPNELSIHTEYSGRNHTFNFGN